MAAGSGRGYDREKRNNPHFQPPSCARAVTFPLLKSQVLSSLLAYFPFFNGVTVSIQAEKKVNKIKVD